jgi:hypothetical protein
MLKGLVYSGCRASVTPIIASRVTSCSNFAASHPSVPAGRSRHDQIAQLAHCCRARGSLVPSGRVRAEFGEDTARVAHRPRAIGAAFVPGRRAAEDAARIAGTERADDEVVHIAGVLNSAVSTVSPLRQAEFLHRRAGVGREPGGEVRIGPGAGDNTRAVLGHRGCPLPFDLGADLGRGQYAIAREQQVAHRHAPQPERGEDGDMCVVILLIGVVVMVVVMVVVVVVIVVVIVIRMGASRRVLPRLSSPAARSRASSVPRIRGLGSTAFSMSIVEKAWIQRS